MLMLFRAHVKRLGLRLHSFEKIFRETTVARVYIQVIGCAISAFVASSTILICRSPEEKQHRGDAEDAELRRVRDLALFSALLPACHACACLTAVRAGTRGSTGGANHFSPLTSHFLLLTSYFSPLTSYFLLLTSHHLLQSPCP